MIFCYTHAYIFQIVIFFQFYDNFIIFYNNTADISINSSLLEKCKKLTKISEFIV